MAGNVPGSTSHKYDRGRTHTIPLYCRSYFLAPGGEVVVALVPDVADTTLGIDVNPYVVVFTDVGGLPVVITFEIIK